MRTLLHVVHYPFFGGPHNQALRLAEPLRERGWDTVVLLPDEPGNAAERLRGAGIEVETMPLHRLRATVDPTTQIRFGVGFPREVRAIRRLLRERNVDLVVVTSLTNPHAATAARLEGIPVTWQLIDTRAPMALRRLLMPLVLRLADSVMTTGYKVAAQHPGATSLGDRLITFFPPVDTDEFRPDEDRRLSARAELRVAADETLVGAVGNLVPQKGYEYLLEAAAMARRSRPRLAVRVLGAHTTTHRAHELRLRSLADALGLDAEAMFVDPRERVAELVPAFDLAVMSGVPRSEGITTALLEATACGVPVVATDVGAVSEGIEDGVTGLMVPPEDVGALTEAIARLADDPELRREMGAAGRARAVAEFSLEASAASHVTAFERALEHHARRRGGEAGRIVRRPSAAGSAARGSKEFRVLLVNKFGHVTGGADQHVVGLAAALREKGHEVRILTTSSPLNLERSGRFVPLLVTNASRDELPALRRAEVAGRAVWNWSAAREMRLLIDEFRPDVVHVHKLYPQLSVAPIVIAARNGIPVVHTLHDLELVAANPLASGGEWRDRLEERADYRALNTATFAIRRFVHRPRVSAFVAPSRFVAEVHLQFGIEAEVIPNFTEFVGRPSGGYEERDGILFVGRLSAHKGITDVLELARALPDRRVTVAGSGPLERRVASAFARLPNADYVGGADRNELESLFSAARVVVMPSAYPEIAPLTAIEAMALGTPVVAYEHSGLAEYVNDSGGGVVVQARADALTETAALLHDDRPLWERLSARATRSVHERHSPEEHADRIVEVYRRVMNRLPAGVRS